MRIRHSLAPLVLLALLAGTASAKEIEGVEYPETQSAAGHSLKLVGVGLRTRWVFNVYTMGVYTASGRKSAGALVNTKEVKFLWLQMKRDVTGKKMAAALEEGIEKNRGEAGVADLRAEIDQLKAMFPKMCKEGVNIGITYIPGDSVIVTSNAKQRGKVSGAKVDDFAKALLQIWFGKKPADKSLKKSVLAD